MTKEEKAKARAQARAEYLQGMSYRQIAVNHGISVGLVAKWAKADGWEVQQVQQARSDEREQRKERERERERRSRETVYEPDDPEDPLDYDVLRKSALLVVAHINQRLMGEKVLEPRDIKAITGALLDLKNQLNALSPRELREQALRLQALRKQAEEQQAAEPVQVVFVNREWEDTPSAADAAAPSEREPGKPGGGAYAEA